MFVKKAELILHFDIYCITQQLFLMNLVKPWQNTADYL